ncbi:NTP transferase domain-containing protein [Halosolutus halophilus]|uniref:NTP transferase domain-containing protein n=1 Tax=Halosolutus halophilus TaxID=1552990 RepID=UPI0022350665|nr:NTP transferase domain-containing protein [Halosolutus halophilus]
MCGGRGTRLESRHEKPLHPIAGRPMVDRVLAALDESGVGTAYAAVSPNAPETRAHLDGSEDARTIETAGDGYVADLTALLDRPQIEPPILTVAADLPLLAGPVIDRVLDRSDGSDDGDGAPSRTVAVPVALKRRLGASIDSRLEPQTHLAPTGINVVGSTDRTMTDVSYDPRLAVNVNRRADADIAAERLAGRNDPCA